MDHPVTTLRDLVNDRVPGVRLSERAKEYCRAAGIGDRGQLHDEYTIYGQRNGPEQLANELECAAND